MKSSTFGYAVCCSLLGVLLTATQGSAIDSQSRTPSQAATIPLFGTVPSWVSKAKKLGPADDNKRVAITAYLSWRNQAELERLILDQTTPGNPRYGQFLTPQQFHAEFSPKPEDVSLVQNTLRGLGFKIEHTPDSGLFVRASGTVAQIREAFHVSQNLYTYRGKTLRAHAEAPSIPASLAKLVTYIAGLDDGRVLIRPAHVQRGAPAKLAGLKPPYGGAVYFPCSNYWGDTVAKVESPSPFPYGSDLPWDVCGYTPQQIKQAYGVNHVTETGKGVRVAITDLYYSATLRDDVNRFSANHGLPPLTYENFVEIVPPGVNVIPAGDPCGALGWFGEQTLDVTAVHSMAPDAFIFFVAGRCDAADEPDFGEAEEPLYEVIDNHLADIVSNSWSYIGEEDVTPGVLQSDTAKFMQAAAQGMTLLFSAGDDGDNTVGSPSRDIASGSWPPTSPYVTAMGGTSLLLKNASGEKSEFGWANYYSAFENALISKNGATVTDQGWTSFFNGGGSGGGPSLLILEPDYQKPVVPKILATQTYTSSGVPVPLDPPRRVTPDISMLADPNTGMLFGETYLIYSPPVDPGCLKLTSTTEYCEFPIGGTSVASPTFAGVLALVNEHRFSQGQGAIGFLNPALYKLNVGEDPGSGAPIIDVNAPSEPIAGLYGFLSFDNFVGIATIDSYPTSSGKIIENVDTSLRSAPGYDNVTGLGVPSVPEFIEALAGP